MFHGIAVDLKTTYVTGNDACNGFTLGAYTGYFINRSSTKNILYPYSAYDYHFILGILYTRGESNERTSYELSDIDNIPSVISDLQFIVQEKYRVALRRPGSGNTKNIGGVRSISKLINGNGDFNSVEEFDDFWMNYDERKKEKKRKQSEERDK